MLSKRLHADSGACFLVGDADFCDFEKKVAEAADFLKSNLALVTKLASFPGVEQATLDFALASGGDRAAIFSYLPPALVRLAAQAGLGIEISCYVCERTSQVDSELASAVMGSDCSFTNMGNK